MLESRPCPFPTLIRAMAPPRRARAPHARPRRGSVERPINARLVRGTWLFVALPLLLAAFTVGRPQPLPAPTLPAAFDGRPPSSWRASSRATTRIELRDLPAASAPPTGSRSSWPSTTSSCRRTASSARSRAAAVSISRTSSRVVRGDSPRAIVITAHRDNNGEGRGANDNASGTAALIELARAYAPVAGHDAADASVPHARLRLHRRRRVRRPRRCPVR